MGIYEEQKCKLCDRSFTVKGILDLADHYWPELDLLMCKSPCCHKSEEVQLKDGQIDRGYVYAAGAPYFAGMELYQVNDLKVVKSASSLTYSLNGNEVTVSAKP